AGSKVALYANRAASSNLRCGSNACCWYRLTQPSIILVAWKWMISFSNINKQYGKQLVFVDASFQLNPGEKVGLVGPNGAGKTTLFRMVVGEESPDEGDVTVPKRLTVGYFRQD